MNSLPKVTVIVLNYNGREHLVGCFDSLSRLDYPAERLEFMLVDNASTDDSVALMRARFPQVRLVVNSENVGFASGNNLGARAATGELVIFLNNDMWVDPRFVRELVAVRQAHPDVVSVAARILNWDGTRLDFAVGALHFAGYAYQVGFNSVVDPDNPGEVAPILFPCGGAMLIDRQTFLDIGAFDDDYFIYYEDVDLGWRLWVMGYRVVVAPKAVVHHRHHGTMAKFPDYRKNLLYKRNAFYSLIKNYDDENLGRVLPAALLGVVSGVVQRTTDSGQLRRAEFGITGGQAPKQPLSIDRHAASTLVAMDDVVRNLPHLMAKRKAIQARRRRSDAEINRLFLWPFRFWPDTSAQAQYQVVDAFNLQALFADTPRRVLVISSDILPYPGLPTVGSGLRAWGLGQGLQSRGHTVLFSMPRLAVQGREHLLPPEAGELAWDDSNLLAIIQRVEADIILVCNWPTLDRVPAQFISAPIVLDQHGPHFLEREYQRAGTSDDNAARKVAALRKADFFTCAGHRQQAYFKTWLQRAGWSEREMAENTAVIPVSLSPDLPEHRSEGDPVFVYGGVFLPWQNPSNGLKAVVEGLERFGRGKLLFFGGKHPVHPVDPGMFEGLLKQLQQSPYVTAAGMLAHEQLLEHYVRAHVAIDVMERNPERELAFTTRTVEYMWCGLPVIHHDYAELSDHIREYEAGWTVDPNDQAALRRVVAEILGNPAEVARRGANAQRLVRERLTWDHTAESLDYFVRHPRLRLGASRQSLPNSAALPSAASLGTLRYLVYVAWSVYRQYGFNTLWRDGWAFLRRQVAARTRPTT